MVHPPHEALHRVFAKDPTLVSRTLEHLLGVRCPKPESIEVMNVDLSEIRVLERRVDTLFWVRAADGPHIFIVESQSARDDEKYSSWTYYVAYLFAKYRCPVTLLVVTADTRTAAWARHPVRVGLPAAPTMIVNPIVLGPDNVPAITDAVRAGRDVVMTVFSALTNRRSHAVTGILDALNIALSTLDTETAGQLAELTMVGLGKDTLAQKHWRNLMGLATFPFQSDYAKELKAEGKAAGIAEERACSILLLLEARGLTVGALVRERVLSCADLDVLEVWRRRAMTVSCADRLFD